MRRRPLLVVGFTLFFSGGCATIPPGPSVPVMPARHASFEAFQADDRLCRSWAEERSGWDANQTVNRNLAGGAAAGALLGAAAGALIGAAAGDAAAGLALGAGGGLLAGTAMAANPALAAGSEVQRRYDHAYQQCMAAKGHAAPAFRPEPHRARHAPPPPPRAYVGPPPPPIGAGAAGSGPLLY
jgi:hypothetical protein